MYNNHIVVYYTCIKTVSAEPQNCCASARGSRNCGSSYGITTTSWLLYLRDSRLEKVKDYYEDEEKMESGKIIQVEGKSAISAFGSA